MKRQLVWAKAVWDLFRQLPERESGEIIQKLDLLVYFPQMMHCAERAGCGDIALVHAGHWLVYYKVVDETIYSRGHWPARTP